MNLAIKVSVTTLVLLIQGFSGLTQNKKRPHIIVFFADDFGWANLGLHRRGSDEQDSQHGRQGTLETHTPHMDKLADEGIVLDRHYVYKICAPSRSSMQSGRLAVHVNTANTGPLAVNPKDPVSGFAGIPRNMTGMAQKLRSAGYRTHMVGKWDAGMATPEQTPLGRGYETWTGYYQHANDYWRKNTELKSSGEVDQCFNTMMDLTTLNSTYRGGVQDAMSLTDSCRRDHEMDPACYEEHIFKTRALEIIESHDTTKIDSPLFLFYAFHLVHSPLQVPIAYIQRIEQLVVKAGGQKFDTWTRHQVAAMALYMDDAIGEVVHALKHKHMWENTLVLFTADNGGAIYEPGGGNNYPLKGGKYSDWEGGVRSNAFVSGGFIPEAKRGSTFSGVISIADWYGTFCEIAGVSAVDTAAENANIWLKEHKLPTLAPVDSVPQWGFIMNGTNGREQPLHVSEFAVLRWPYKLIMGKQQFSAWTGPVYPNCSTVHSVTHQQGPDFDDFKVFNKKLNPSREEHMTDVLTWTQNCRSGCLFNVALDPTEHNDLSTDPEYAKLLFEMQGTLTKLNKKLFNPDRGDSSAAGCKTALRMDGYLGPFIDAQDFYMPKPHISIAKHIKNFGLNLLFEFFNLPSVKSIVQNKAQKGYPAFTKLAAPRVDKCLVNRTESNTLFLKSLLI